jgi:hypothetical protein
MTKEADDALIRGALERSRGVEGGIRKRARAIGVSPGTLRIWEETEKKGGSFPPLRDPVRDRLNNKRSVNADEMPYNEEREEEELRRVGELDDPILRVLERESISAIIRAQAVREAAWGYRISEQNTAARLVAVREATARGDAGEPISDAETLDAIARRQRRGRKKASGE